ncbi:hypothetical protein ONE63_008062 [Megalurothrips usitatus]|uniref:Uncharacterized protein n=1 Tax=Megalurothrips usitatus TaxID=439358 RepID=A0AAV7XTW1_9NEOP|nr:hypothetical protein ONE63_008062 [Megalurothrips usitatus]
MVHSTNVPNFMSVAQNASTPKAISKMRINFGLFFMLLAALFAFTHVGVSALPARPGGYRPPPPPKPRPPMRV